MSSTRFERLKERALDIVQVFASERSYLGISLRELFLRKAEVGATGLRETVCMRTSATILVLQNRNEIT
jgi:hypothetical protein